MKLKNLFKRITNEFVTIELKNGIQINGTVVEIDRYMNVHLKDAKRAIKGKSQIAMETISIRGSKIRFIILPTWLNFDSIFKKML